MDDLRGFEIERAPGEGAPGRFATIDMFELDDQTRFRKERRLEWIDRDVRAGERYSLGIFLVDAVLRDEAGYPSAQEGPMRALLAVLGLASFVYAADQTILGKQLQVKDPKPGIDATKRRVLAQGKEKGSPNTIVGDPTVAGATLTVFANGTTASNQTFSLPAALWTAVKAGFNYKDARLTMGPVKMAAITVAKGTFQLKAVVSGKAGGISVVPPNDGTDGCVLLIIGGGDSYSVRFADGVISNQGPKEFKVARPTSEGSCVPARGIGLTPSAVSFGSVNLGSTSPGKTVTVTSIGAGAVTLSSISFTGPNPGDFTITGNTCPATIASGASCSVTVAFAPGTAGTRTASLTFTSNGTGSPQSVALSGTGQALTRMLDVSPSSLKFGTVNLGSTSSGKTVTVTSSGTGAATLSSISLTGADPGDFTITGNTCPATIASGASCLVTVAFAPGTAGTRTASLTFTSNGTGSPQSVALSGRGQ